MTSRKSLTKPASYAFKNAIGGMWFVPVLNMLALIVICPILSFIYLADRTEAIKDTSPFLPGGEEEKIKTLFYLFTDAQLIFSMVLIIFASVVLGIISFKFFTSKKMVNVYYSLGVKRNTLYLARYIPGVLMLIASIAIPFIINGFVSMHFFGSSSELWQAVFYYILNLSALAVFIFSLTSAIYSCVGTTFEGMLFTAVSLSAPSIVLFALDNFMRALLWGSPIGKQMMSPITPDAYSSRSLVSEYKQLNPLLFPLKNGFNYVEASTEKLEDGKIAINMFNDQKWVDPSFLMPLIWLLIGIAIGALGLFLFRRRKAELCGFLGKNKVLNSVATFAVAFFGFSVVFSYHDKLGTLLCFVIGFALMTAIYCIFDGLLTRVLADFKKGLIKLPFHLGVASIIALVFLTGCFGYSSKLPKPDEIEVVHTTLSARSPFISEYSMEGFAMPTPSGFEYSGSNTLSKGFKSKSDLELVTKFHKDFINLNGKKSDSAFSARVDFMYKLKNGKVILRSYDLATEEMLAALLKYEETDLYKQNVKSYLEKDTNFDNRVSFISPSTMKQTVINSSSSGGSMGGNMIDYIGEGGIEIATEPDVAVPAEAEADIITEEQFNELKECLAADFLAQLVEDRYFSNKHEQIGFISFYSQNSSLYDNSLVCIDAGMKNTVKFLEKYDLMQYFKDDDLRIESAEVVSVKEMKQLYDENFNYINGIILEQFIAYNTTVYNYYDDWGMPSPKCVNVKDPEKIAELRKADIIHAYTKGEGYIVKYTLSGDADEGGGKKVFMQYIRQADAPEYIRQALAQ